MVSYSEWDTRARFKLTNIPTDKDKLEKFKSDIISKFPDAEIVQQKKIGKFVVFVKLTTQDQFRYFLKSYIQ